MNIHGGYKSESQENKDEAGSWLPREPCRRETAYEHHGGEQVETCVDVLGPAPPEPRAVRSNLTRRREFHHFIGDYASGGRETETKRERSGRETERFTWLCAWSSISVERGRLWKIADFPKTVSCFVGP